MKVRLSGGDRKAIAAKIKADIDAACVERFTDDPRAHLGGSEIGEKCARRLVYSFRWMHRQQFSGQMLRLFNRGHLEEKRIIEFLRFIGATAFECDPDTGKQFHMGDGGHYGGSLDGKVILPPSYQLDFEFLLEMKTHNLKSFTKLVADGVKIAQPKHFAQMCAYGHAYNYDYAIYFAVNKNSDEIHIEIVEIDKTFGAQLARKAQSIIAAPSLPNKIAASEAYMECKFCPMVGICHLGKPVDVNCRSCISSNPLPDGTWECRLWGSVIPAAAIPAACPSWQAFT